MCIRDSNNDDDDYDYESDWWEQNLAGISWENCRNGSTPIGTLDNGT